MTERRVRLERIETDNWLEDAFVIEWLSKVGERTQKNYKERYPKWLAFIGMTPSE
jgi:hypothetical protein